MVSPSSLFLTASMVLLAIAPHFSVQAPSSSPIPQCVETTEDGTHSANLNTYQKDPQEVQYALGSPDRTSLFFRKGTSATIKRGNELRPIHHMYIKFSVGTVAYTKLLEVPATECSIRKADTWTSVDQVNYF